MKSEYDLAYLANKLLNVAGEIDDEEPIAAQAFKSSVSGDLMRGRNPYERPFDFNPMAAHWFAGNHYITTRDTTAGFWRRWLVFRFWTGKEIADRDTTLYPRILEYELPAIVAWAIRGAEALVAEGFTETFTHAFCIDEWKGNNDSVASWLNAEDSGVAIRTEKLSTQIGNVAAYDLYKRWCSIVQRKPLGRNKFLDRLAECGHPNSRRVIGTLRYA